MKILISGAGVAGLTLAYWLNRYGFSVSLVEKAPVLRTGGYKVDIRGVALDVVKIMKIHPALLDLKTDIQGATIVDKEGNLITEMSGDTFGLRVSEDVEIMRGDLCKLLLNQIGNVECRFGDTISAIFQNNNDLSVQFEGGSSDRYDIIVGADGLHSSTRKLVFGEESLFSKELGFYISIFSVPNNLNLDRWEMEYCESGKMVNLFSSKGDSMAKAAFLFASPPPHFDLRNTEKVQEWLKSIYSGIGWEVPQLLSAMARAPDFYFDSITQICMNHWSKGRVVLVGDAGYCASPISGQGTSLALVGAYVLAGELAKAKGNYKIAFAQYEREIRKYVQRNQKIGQIAAKMLLAENTLFAWIHEQVMKIIPGKWSHYIKNRFLKNINAAAKSYSLKSY